MLLLPLPQASLTRRIREDDFKSKRSWKNLAATFVGNRSSKFQSLLYTPRTLQTADVNELIKACVLSKLARHGFTQQSDHGNYHFFGEHKLGNIPAC